MVSHLPSQGRAVLNDHLMLCVVYLIHQTLCLLVPRRPAAFPLKFHCYSILQIRNVKKRLDQLVGRLG